MNDREKWRLMDWWADTTGIGSVSAAPFTPTSISGLKLWLKADAGTFQTVGGVAAAADADPVGEWLDQSGNGKNVVQATSTKRGTLKTGANGQNSKPVIRGDGVDDALFTASLVSAATDNFTVFIAHKVRNSTGAHVDFHNGVLGGGYHFTSNNTTREIGYAGVSDLADGTFVPGTFEVACLKRAAGTSTLRIQGASQSLTNSTATPNTPATSLSLLGRGNGVGDLYSDADIAEVILYESALGAPQIAQVETYLNARWAAF